MTRLIVETETPEQLEEVCSMLHEHRYEINFEGDVVIARKIYKIWNNLLFMSPKYTPEKSSEIILEIYRRMYRETEPSADLNKLMESGETQETDWFLRYYLDEKRQDEIVDEVLDEYNVKGRSRRSLRAAVTLGSSPTALREVMERERAKE